VWQVPDVILTLLACTTTCDAPRVLDDRTYDVFGNLVDFESVGNGVPPEGFPVNGTTAWTFDWGASDDGPVAWRIDDQPIDTVGEWNPTGCNTFSLDAMGTWTSPGGVRHVFETTGDFLYFGTFLEGRMTWSDRWSFGESSGTIEADEAVVSGVLRGP
jgi:hypothetical protein